ncbi:FtsX-like permease family protein [Fulvivirga sp. M361]|uniref:ABC transporter permease n=1 Tax=Fulvivirga sp. M361 TaxID=2594266 RepID=UPI00117A4556|nr:ABC transporter permease [Fulvivirga sp. M361]TRX62636.1 FtsX-like permease family protein [Fulvivirga sp. M361]
MIRNYFKIAFRNLVKQKLYSAINILGLGFGMACVLLICFYVQDELSYDQFHDDAKDIYRIAWWGDNPQTRTPHPMAQALVKDFPQVSSATSLSPLWGPGLTKQTFSIRNLEKDLTFDESDILSVDSTFFEVFSFELLKGNRQKVLRGPGGLLLSESSAFKYFGGEDPIGKQLAINNDETLLTVEGIFKDVPANSHFHFDMLISYVTLKYVNPDDAYYTWADFGHFNYIRLLPGADPMQLQEQLMDWVQGYIQLSKEEIQQVIETNLHFRLQRITDIHLKSAIRWELAPNGNRNYVYIMTAAALLILITACVNFMNLTTSRSTERSKEIGVRKSLGALKGQLQGQFLGESVLTALLGMLLAGFLAEVSLPFFNHVTGKGITIEYWQNPMITLSIFGIGILTGVVSGLYPAFFLSSIHPVISLKGLSKVKPSGAWFRKGLMVFQFTISMALITGSFVIYDQLQFIQNKDLGFNKEQLMLVPVKDRRLQKSMNELRTELLKIEGVAAVSGTSNVPGKQFNQNSIYKTDRPDTRISASEVFVDHAIFTTLDLSIVQGHGFDKDRQADSSAFIINETAARNLGLTDPIGEEITWEWDNNGQPPVRGTVIGIVKDFNYNSLHQPVRPLLFCLRNAYNHTLIRMNTSANASTIKAIESVWQKFDHRFEFEYSFLSDDLEAQYIGEQKTAQVFSGFSIIAVAIACFGLFGIASLNYAQRAKEVSIRKVMGASTARLLHLLVYDFLRLISLAIIISIPLAWGAMESWLQNFTYRITLNPLDFIIAAIALLTVALLTVSYLTWHTSVQNPIKSLKEE